MEYENDFVEEKPVEIKIDGRVFKYKPTTGGDENEWLKEIMVVDPQTKTTGIDWSQYNKKKLGNITSVPYSKEVISKIIGQEKDWAELTNEERYKLLGKLKPGMFDKLINGMKAVDEPDHKSVKN